MKISKVWLECLFSVIVVGICSVVSLMLRNHLALENFAIIYMFGVLAVSVRCSRVPAMANAFLAVGSFHYFCVPPFDTFIIEDSDYAVTLVGMLTIALVTTTLTMKIHGAGTVPSLTRFSFAAFRIWIPTTELIAHR